MEAGQRAIKIIIEGLYGGVMSVPRTEKLNAEFQRCIYDVLKNKVKDPRLTEMFSVTKVDIDKELSIAKVYISVFSGDKTKAEETFAAIESSAGFVRRELAKGMRIRTVPPIKFIYDDTMEYSEKIDRLLDRLLKKDDTQGEVEE